jgi:predicted  nucleic acid-binding Zn-ribbon protein
MHHDTLCLIALHKADLAHENLAAQLAGLKQAIQTAGTKVGQAERAEATERTALTQLQASETSHSTRYERYLKKSFDTEALLQTGQLTNYAAGEQQLKKCRAIADEEETCVLELMESIEEKQADILAKATQVALRQEHLQTKSKRFTDKEPGLIEDLARATVHRDSQAQAVRDDHLSQYDQIRKKLRFAVVTISHESCDGCGMGISSMPLAEHVRGSAVHTCANCGRFLGEVL